MLICDGCYLKLMKITAVQKMCVQCDVCAVLKILRDSN